MLRSLGYAPTNYNAEFIHDYLPKEAEVDCVLMNPPFSSSGGRTKNNSCKFGFRRVESAFERLKKGGKFGVIWAMPLTQNARAGNDFWEKPANRISLKAIIKFSGREYYKNGTSVGVNVFIGEKLTELEKSRKRENEPLVNAPHYLRGGSEASGLNRRDFGFGERRAAADYLPPAFAAKFE